MRLQRQSIDVTLEDADGNNVGLVRFRRLPQNVIYDQRENARALEKERLDILKAAGYTEDSFQQYLKEHEGIAIRDMPANLSNGLSRVIMDLNAVTRAGECARFESCYHCEGLDVDGRIVTVDDVRACRLPADIAELLLEGYSQAEAKILNPESTETDAKNGSSSPEQSSDLNTSNSMSTPGQG